MLIVLARWGGLIRDGESAFGHHHRADYYLPGYRGGGPYPYPRYWISSA